MPFLCQRCMNGFTSAETCIKHLLVQHNMDESKAAMHVVVNKLGLTGSELGLNGGALYEAGAKAAKMLIAKKQQQQLMTSSGKQSAPVYAPPTVGMSTRSTLITEPPVRPASCDSTNSDVIAADVQPLDFSIRKRRSSPPLTSSSRDATDAPLDLSVNKPLTSSVQSMMTSETSMSSSSVSSALKPVNVRVPSLSRHQLFHACPHPVTSLYIQ